MKTILFSALLMLNLFAQEIPNNHLVSSSWLQKNVSMKNLIVIDTRDEKSYHDSHIPNAINIPKKMWFQGKIENIPKLYNTAPQMQTLFQNAGINEDSIVIFYSAGKDNKDFADAASALWSFWLYGFKNSAILNGGFNKWKNENHQVSSKIPSIKKSDFEIDTFDSSVLASLPSVIQAQYNDSIQLSDARVSKFYTGEIGRDDLKRKGRIPTAKLTPMIRYTKKVGDSYVFLDKKEASKTLNNNDFGLNLEDEAIFYCNTGHKARGLWFVSKFIIGMKNVKVYDASMVEYTRTLLPMQTGEYMD